MMQAVTVMVFMPLASAMCLSSVSPMPRLKAKAISLLISNNSEISVRPL